MTKTFLASDELVSKSWSW